MNKLALYIQGDIYPSSGNDPQQVVDSIVNSSLTTPILGLCHVNCSEETCPGGNSPAGSHDGDLTFNDTLIIRDGKYVGDPSWPETIKSLRAGQVSEIYASFGGYGVPDYSRIAAIMKKYGTGHDSPLNINFKCLKETLGLDGIDFDDEDSYVVDTIVEFGNMLLSLDYKITFCPYGSKQFWSSCIEGLGASNVQWLNLQCYAGGKGNNPADWADLGVPIVAGVGVDCCCPQTNCSPTDIEAAFHAWTTGQGSVSGSCWAGTVGESTDLLGGFIWTYHEIASDLDTYIDAMNQGLS